MKLNVQVVLVSDELLDKLSERWDGLVDSEQDRRMIIEHRQLVIRPGMVRAEGIPGRQQPSTWPENPQHLVYSSRNVSHVMKRSVAADHVEALFLKGKDGCNPADPASLGHDRSSPPDQHGVVLESR